MRLAKRQRKKGNQAKSDAFRAGKKQKGQRKSMLLGLARSKKGSENRGNRRNPLPFPGETRRKGNENRGNRRNPMPFPGETRRKGNEKRET